MKYRISYACFVILLLFSLGAGLLGNSQSASAATTSATWVNMATLSYNGQTFKETNAGDANWHFYEQSPADKCPDEIDGFNYDANNGPYKTQTVQLHENKPVPGGCSSADTVDINLPDQPPNYKIAFIWQDNSNIVSADGKKTFALDAQSGKFISTADSSSCKDFISVGSNPSIVSLTIRSNQGKGDDAGESLSSKYGGSDSGNGSGWPFVTSIQSAGDVKINGETCHESKPVSVDANATNATVKGAPSSGGAGGSGIDQATLCEAHGISLSWLLCPIINGLASATDSIFNNVAKPLLQTGSIDVTNPNDPSYYTFKVWSSFRIYGNVLLILALLVIVFGQSIGGGLIDSYTAKKIAPRLLIAAIMINLSIYAVALLVDITNILGSGVYSLMTSPLANAGALKFGISGATSGISIAGLGVAGAGAVGLVASGLAVPLLLSFLPTLLLVVLLPAFLAVIAVIATLLLRRGIIILLIVISPLAFALYCLPNTEKYFRKWWDLLFKTLMVYPITLAIIGAINILAVVMSPPNGGSAATQFLDNFASMILIVIPLFIIPFAFKLSGGVVGSIYGAANNLGKQATQKIKGDPRDPNSLISRATRNRRSGMAEATLTPGMIGSRLNPTRMFSESGRMRRRSHINAQRDAAIQTLRQGTTAQAMYEANKDSSDVMGDVALYKSGADSRAAIDRQFSNGDFGTGQAAVDRRQQLYNASAAADRMGRSVATRRAAIMNGATIGYALGAGEDGWHQATAAMREISGATVNYDDNGKPIMKTLPGGEQVVDYQGGNEGEFRNMVNEFQYNAKGVGRGDLAGNVDSDVYNGNRAWGSIGLYQVGNGKPNGIKGSSSYFKSLVGRTQSGGQGLTHTDIQEFGSRYLAPGVSFKDLNPAQIDALRPYAAVEAKRAAAVFTREMNTVGGSATGAVRDAATVARTEMLASDPDVSRMANDQTDTDIRTRTRGYDPLEREATRAERGF